MSAERYSQEQILCGLRIVWAEIFGFDSSFDLDTRLDNYHAPYFGPERVGDRIGRLMGEEDALRMIANTIAICFGFTCSLEEWNNYFGLNAASREEWERDFAPRFTIRGLVEFIQERAEPIPLQPITILGKPCLTAGIYRGLEQLVRQTRPKAPRFGPSTPIHQCLRGEWLHIFWRRLRWLFQDQLPPPRQITFRSQGFLHSLFFKFGAGLLVALWRRDLTGLLEGMGVTFALFIPVGVIVAFINAHVNPLPREIKTFGDLARYLAVVTVDQQPQGA